MQICKAQLDNNDVRVALLDDDHLQLLEAASLSEILHADNPVAVAKMLVDHEAAKLSLKDVSLLAPLDRQEVWAAGVTYVRSKDAREQESEGAAKFYDMVYTAERPELFFKAPAWRVVAPGARIRIRRDGKWNVPEPEIALVVSPKLQIVGYTIGNDVSSRDIEGENPLYLPQAKFYDGSCALGPVITLAEAMPPREEIRVKMTIERQSATEFQGETSAAKMARTFEDLVDWVGRETSFPHGLVLLTGTGIVPPDDFTLAAGDRVVIEMRGVGQLVNVVDQRPEEPISV